MARFVLTAQIQVQGPSQAQLNAVSNQIRQGLNGGNIDLKVNIPQQALRQLNQVNRQMQQIQNSANGATSSMYKFGYAFSQNVKRYGTFTAATSAFVAFGVALKRSLSDAVEFETQMTKISQVTNQTLESLNPLKNQIDSLGKSLGISTIELAHTARVLSQANLSANQTRIALEALAKTRLAASFGDIGDTTEATIAILNQFQNGAKTSKFAVQDLEQVLGSINKVSGQYAVEAEDITAAVRRAGAAFAAASPQAQEAKKTFAEFLALFTTVRQTTRGSAESIATGIRTIVTRVQRTSSISLLKQFGIDLQDSEGQFIGAYQAIEKISKALQEIPSTDSRFAQIVEVLGGYRQIDKTIPLLKNLALTQQVYNTALEGTDSLNKDVAKSQQTLAVQFGQLRANFDSLVRKITEDEGIRTFVGFMIEASNAAIRLASALTPLIAPLTFLAAFKFGANFSGFARGVVDSAKGLKPRYNTGGEVLGFNKGGYVPGVGNSDTVNARLTPGEFVFNKKATQALGPERLQRMQKFAEGGQVFSLNDLRNIKEPGTINSLVSKKNELSLSRLQNVDSSITSAISSLLRSRGVNIDEQFDDVEIDGIKITNPTARSAKQKRSFSSYLGGVSVVQSLAAPSIPQPVLTQKAAEEKKKRQGQAGFIQNEIGALFPSVTSRGTSRPITLAGANLEKFKKLTGESVDFLTMNVRKFPLVDKGADSSIEKITEQTLANTALHIARDILNPSGNKSLINVASATERIQKIGYKDVKGKVFEASIGLLASSLGKSAKDTFDFQGETNSEFLKLFQGAEKGIPFFSDAKATDNSNANESLFIKALNIPRDQFKYGLIDTTNPDNADIANRYEQSRRAKRNQKLKAQRRAAGGSIFAANGSDTVPAMLTPGEFVINRDSARKIGYAKLNSMNKSPTKYMASGGIVPHYFARGTSGNGVPDDTRQIENDIDKLLKAFSKFFGVTTNKIVKNVELIENQTTSYGGKRLGGFRIEDRTVGVDKSLNREDRKKVVGHEFAHGIDLAFSGRDNKLATSDKSSPFYEYATSHYQSTRREARQAGYTKGYVNYATRPEELFAQNIGKETPEFVQQLIEKQKQYVKNLDAVNKTLAEQNTTTQKTVVAQKFNLTQLAQANNNVNQFGGYSPPGSNTSGSNQINSSKTFGPPRGYVYSKKKNGKVFNEEFRAEKAQHFRDVTRINAEKGEGLLPKLGGIFAVSQSISSLTNYFAGTESAFAKIVESSIGVTSAFLTLAVVVKSELIPLLAKVDAVAITFAKMSASFAAISTAAKVTAGGIALLGAVTYAAGSVLKDKAKTRIFEEGAAGNNVEAYTTASTAKGAGSGAVLGGLAGGLIGLIGGPAGAVLGAKIGTVAGTLIGAAIGNSSGEKEAQQLVREFKATRSSENLAEGKGSAQDFINIFNSIPREQKYRVESVSNDAGLGEFAQTTEFVKDGFKELTKEQREELKTKGFNRENLLKNIEKLDSKGIEDFQKTLSAQPELFETLGFATLGLAKEFFDSVERTKRLGEELNKFKLSVIDTTLAMDTFDANIRVIEQNQNNLTTSRGALTGQFGGYKFGGSLQNVEDGIVDSNIKTIINSVGSQNGLSRVAERANAENASIQAVRKTFIDRFVNSKGPADISAAQTFETDFTKSFEDNLKSLGNLSPEFADLQKKRFENLLNVEFGGESGRTEKTLKTLGDPDALKEMSEKFAKAMGKTTEWVVKFQETLSQFQGDLLNKSQEITKLGLEETYSKFDATRQYNDTLGKLSELRGSRTSSQDILNSSIGLQNQFFGGRTVGSYAASYSNARNEVSRLEAKRNLSGGTLNDADFNKLQYFANEVQKSGKALEYFRDKTDIAAKAETRLNELRQERENKRGFLFGQLGANPVEAAKRNRTLGQANQILSGQLPIQALNEEIKSVITQVYGRKGEDKLLQLAGFGNVEGVTQTSNEERQLIDIMQQEAEMRRDATIALSDQAPIIRAVSQEYLNLANSIQKMFANAQNFNVPQGQPIPKQEIQVDMKIQDININHRGLEPLMGMEEGMRKFVSGLIINSVNKWWKQQQGSQNAVSMGLEHIPR